MTTPDPIGWRGALSAAQVDIATEARLGESKAFMLHVAAVGLQDTRRLVVTLADVGPIRQAERDREEALAFVSHDLRSPAQSIVMLADLNLQAHVETPRDDLLRQVRQLANRTLELADAFARSSRAQSQALRRGEVLLRALIDDALTDLRPQAAVRAVKLAVQVADASVDVDRFLVVRAVANLVSNAIRHSPRADIVSIDATVDAGLLRVRVRDHGPGLSPEQRADLGTGEHGARPGDSTGVGLGLVFVQRVAERHGGRLLALAPTKGSGAVFELQLAR